MQFASRAVLVVLRDDGIVGWPPVPAELIEAFPDRFPKHAQRKTWGRPWRARRIGRITSDSRDAHLTVVHVVVALQLRVTDGPVFSRSVQVAHSKIRRMK